MHAQVSHPASRLCGPAGVADIPLTALQLDASPETWLRWHVRVHKGTLLLMLSGAGKQCMTCCLIGAVADSRNGHVKLQCELDFKLLFPPLNSGQVLTVNSGCHYECTAC